MTAALTLAEVRERLDEIERKGLTVVDVTADEKSPDRIVWFIGFRRRAG